MDRVRAPLPDAHLPPCVSHGVAEVTQLAEAHGFRPGRDPYGRWRRA